MDPSSTELKDVQPTNASLVPRNRVNRMLRLGLFIIGGAIAGYAYYRFVGCRTGTCPISGNPYISTIYGALMGFLISGGMK
jgi:Family of unknown function (DUF6132)